MSLARKEKSAASRLRGSSELCVDADKPRGVYPKILKQRGELDMKLTKKEAQGLLLAWMTLTDSGQKAAKAIGFITLMGILTLAMIASCSS